jgi:hypothetical protein
MGDISDVRFSPGTFPKPNNYRHLYNRQRGPQLHLASSVQRSPRKRGFEMIAFAAFIAVPFGWYVMTGNETAFAITMALTMIVLVLM